MSAYHNARYRRDPEYRARVLTTSKAYTERMRADPIFRELAAVRKHIVETRDAYESYSAKAEQRFQKLQELIRRRDQLAKEWKAKRKGNAA